MKKQVLIVLFALSLVLGSASLFADNGDSYVGEPAFNFLSRTITGASTYEITISPDGHHLYATTGHFSYSISGQFYPATGELLIFERNIATGELSLLDTIRHGDEGVVYMVAPGRGVFSPDGEYLYLPSGADSLFQRGMKIFKRNAITGLLSQVAFVSTASGNNPLISEDGKFLYSYGSNLGAELRQYKRDISTGILNFLGYAEIPISSIDFLESLMFSPDGAFLYAAAGTYKTKKGVVFWYTRDETSGELSLLGSLGSDTMGLPSIRLIEGSPDGKHYYVGMNCSPCPAGILSPDENGNLIFGGTIPGTNAVKSMVFAYLGTRLFVSSGSTITAFQRDAETGSLNALQVYEGDARVNNLVLSPDERHLYAPAYFTSPAESYVLIFEVAEPIDSDSDGLPDYLEDSGCTGMQDADTDDDGIPDGVEDANHNGVVNEGETNPCDADTDDDGIQDGTESGIATGHPTDTGENFIPDADSGMTITDPLDEDSDDDGLLDGEEDVNHNGQVDEGETNPIDPDSDDDGMPDGWEVQYNLNPLVNDANVDTDGDGYKNIIEYQKNTDPQDQDSHPSKAMPWLPLLLGE